METFTIKSRTFGDIEFSRPGKTYVYADLNGKAGTLGRQICHHGELLGSTLCFGGEDQSDFERTCRTWYRAYLRKYG